MLNTQTLQILQNQFSNRTGVASGFLTPEGVFLTQPSNFSNLCQLIRSSPKGAENCRKSDIIIGQANRERPIIQLCLSGGLWDAGASIHCGQTHIASWLMGQVFNEAQVANLGKMMAYAQSINVDIEKFSYAISSSPVMNQAKFEALSYILFVLARQISSFISGEGERRVDENQQKLQKLIEQQPCFSNLLEVWQQLLIFHQQNLLCQQAA